jgi:uncharacterized protein YjbI with pentapeptide repeats
MSSLKFYGVEWKPGISGERRIPIEIDLSNAKLCDAILNNEDLSRANLAGADIRRAKLHQANLRKAYLNKVDLREAFLPGAISGKWTALNPSSASRSWADCFGISPGPHNILTERARRVAGLTAQVCYPGCGPADASALANFLCGEITCVCDIGQNLRFPRSLLEVLQQRWECHSGG